MMSQYKENKNEYKILTDLGFCSFSGIAKMGDDRTIILTFEDDSSLECSSDHKIYISLSDYKNANDLEIGDQVVCGTRTTKLKHKIYTNKKSTLFDIISVSNGNRYYANNILVSNCNFVIFEETLINPLKLNQLQGIEPIEKMGQVRWYAKPTKGNVYICALDPSLGTGGNNASIQVFEANTSRQIAEWCHNKTPIEGQVNLLKEITTYLFSITESLTDIYFSVENNTIGEAILVAIRNVGEENIPGIFLSEPAKLGNVRKFRQGFNTTNSNKLAACARLKSLVESDKIKIYSKKLVSELKTFVSVENTYKGKTGEPDDNVLSMILIIRMWDIIKTYVPALADIKNINEYSIPLPFVLSSYRPRLW